MLTIFAHFSSRIVPLTRHSAPKYSTIETSTMSARLILLALSIVVILPAYTLYHMFHSGKKPKGVYWIPSGKNGLFAALESSVNTAVDIRKTLEQSDKLPSARLYGFKFSTVLDGAIVALPMRNFKWLASLPETTASFYKAHEEQLQLSYTVPAATLSDPGFIKILVKVLTRRSKSAVPDLRDEVEAAYQDVSYGGSEWQSLCLYREILRILTVTTNRMLVGLPICEYRTQDRERQNLTLFRS
jgi:hypothetical protein